MSEIAFLTAIGIGCLAVLAFRVWHKRRHLKTMDSYRIAEGELDAELRYLQDRQTSALKG